MTNTIVEFTVVECMTSEQGGERGEGRALHGTLAESGASSLQRSDDLSICITFLCNIQNRPSISEEKSTRLREGLYAKKKQK